MRKLNTSDLFRFSRLLKRGGVGETVIELFKQGSKKGANVTEVGVQVAMALLDAAANEAIEQEIYAFLGAVTEKTAEQIANQDLLVTFEDVTEIVRENDFRGFFTKAIALPTRSSTSSTPDTTT